MFHGVARSGLEGALEKVIGAENAFDHSGMRVSTLCSSSDGIKIYPENAKKYGISDFLSDKYQFSSRIEKI